MSGPGLLVPLKANAEVTPLLEAGADSFYGGLVLPHPEGETAATDPAGCLVSRRAHPSNNFPDVESFRAAQREIAAAGRSLFLTLNEHSNPPEVMARIATLLEQLLADEGLSGIIVADLGLASWLSEHFPDLILVASTGLALSNSGAVQLARKMGFDRVVFPRMLRVEEMAALVKRCPEIEFEAFVMNDRCPNMDGLCNFVHWEVGETHFPNQCRYVRLENATSPVDCRPNFNLSMRFREDACGACSLHDLVQAGVQHLKIVGRDRPLPDKLRAVTFLAGLLEAIEERDLTAETFHLLAKERYRETFGHSCTPDQCYLPGSSKASPGQEL